MDPWYSPHGPAPCKSTSSSSGINNPAGGDTEHGAAKGKFDDKGNIVPACAHTGLARRPPARRYSSRPKGPAQVTSKRRAAELQFGPRAVGVHV